MIYQCQNCDDVFEEPAELIGYKYLGYGCPSCGAQQMQEIPRYSPYYEPLYRQYLKSIGEEEE